MQKHMHTHNKVPECSVYIIVFEMVMHEPVNQLATDKRAGHVPNNTHTYAHVDTSEQNYILSVLI